MRGGGEIERERERSQAESSVDKEWKPREKV